MNNEDQTSWKESPYLIIKGFLMGSADIVPGVSGGTLALITGIYDRLIFAIKSVDFAVLLNFLKFRFQLVFKKFHWRFFLLLFTGILSAVFFFTKIVPLQIYMFTHPEIVYGLFFGLIFGSIFLLYADLNISGLSIKTIVPIIAGSLIGFWVVTLVPADTPDSFLIVFLSGAVAITAMIMPGISGSYILLILRKYEYVLSQIGLLGTDSTLQALINLIPFVLGMIFGLALFTRILSWFLKKYYKNTLLVLIGFLIGSLFVIWPYQDREYKITVKSSVWMETDSHLVTELMQRSKEPNLPEYRRLSENMDKLSEADMEKQVKVETVSKKMVSSSPYIPGIPDEAQRTNENIAGGLAGIAIGLLLIAGISYLRKYSEV